MTPDPSGGSRWLVRHPARVTTRWRLICLPHAGAGAAAYGRWPALVPDDWEVVAVRPPGRESRFAEPPLTSVAEVVDGLADALESLSDLPFVVFGHSMGALLGHDLVRELARRGRPLPELLVVSGHPSPTRPRTSPQLHDLPPAAFVEALRALGGTPPELLEHDELLALFIPLLRADLQLVETAAVTGGPPLPVRLAVYHATGDDTVTRAELDAWSEVTTHPVVHRSFAGDHFYLTAAPESVVAVVTTERCTPVGARCTPSPAGTAPPTGSG